MDRLRLRRASWGWRLPFWLSVAVVIVGYVVRARLDETPAFQSEVSHEDVPQAPLKTLLTDYRKELLQVFFAALIASVGTTFAVFSLSFALSMRPPVSTSTLLWTAIIGNLIWSSSFPCGLPFRSNWPAAGVHHWEHIVRDWRLVLSVVDHDGRQYAHLSPRRFDFRAWQLARSSASRWRGLLRSSNRR
jgi:MFS family permease